MHSKNHITLLVLGWACLLLCTGCSTRDNTRGSRAYHEFTTRYNVYYNAEKTYQEILDQQLESLSEDYSRLLPYSPALPDTSKSIAGGPFNAVIDKTENAIREHSISAKPRRDPSRPGSPEYRQWLRQNEFNPFIHQAWLLMGKAHVQNGDHEQALSVFNEAIRIFGPESGTAYEARLWMAQAYIGMGRQYEAEQIIYGLKTSPVPGQLEELLAEVNARYYLQSGDYAQAIFYLKESIRSEKRFKQKKRLQFLLAQLYTLQGEKEQAHRAFNELKGLSTPREIVQNATAYQLALTTGKRQGKLWKEWERLQWKGNDVDSLSVYRRLHDISLLAGNDSLALHVREKVPDIELAELPGDKKDTSPMPRAISERPQSGELADSIIQEDHWSFFRTRWLRGNRFHHESHSGKSIESEPVVFSPERDVPHTLLLLPESRGQDYEQLLFATTRFNFERYRLRTFDVSFIPLTRPGALSIRPFPSFDEANRYARVLEADSLFRTALLEEAILLAISEENLGLLHRGADVEQYLAFLATAFDAEPIALETNVGSSEPKGSSESTDPLVPADLIEAVEDSLAISPGKESRKPEKTVPLNTVPVDVTGVSRWNAPIQTDSLLAPPTPGELKRLLEEKEAQALRQTEGTATPKSREQLLKERERERQERIKQRERALKERQREREALLKQRERERQQRIRSR